MLSETLTLDTVVHVLVADDMGNETMTPVGATEPVAADTFSDIVMGCDNPGNDTWCIQTELVVPVTTNKSVYCYLICNHKVHHN